MNILLWILQIALAWLCIAGGIYQIFKIEQMQKNVASMRALPRSLWAFLGGFGCLAGLCLILPGAINVLPIGDGVHGGVHRLWKVRPEPVLISRADLARRACSRPHRRKAAPSSRS